MGNFCRTGVPFVTYSEAIQYLQGTNRAFCKPGTERVAELCALLGNPQKELSVVHVAGTNGKGSFCVFLASLLQASGYRVGRFSSPALERINECVTVNGGEISNEDFSRLVSMLQPLADGQTDRPTEFEILTALAFRYFREQNCDFVILECGMGGLTDATNVIHRPLLSVITEISVDHASFLGETVEKIATHKAGIIKENSPALWCGKNPEAERVIRRVCSEKNAELFTVPKDTLQIKKADLTETVFDFDGRSDLSLSMLGLYQPENAANALTALKILGISPDRKQLTDGLLQARLAGRFEVLSRSPLVIADGGHNPDGVARAVESIQAYVPKQKVVLISGIMRDKEYRTVAEILAPVAHCVYTVTPPNPRALPAEEYAKVFGDLQIPATPCETVKEALCRAISHRLPVVCLGSLYQYKEVRAGLSALGIAPLDKSEKM